MSAVALSGVVGGVHGRFHERSDAKLAVISDKVRGQTRRTRRSTKTTRFSDFIMN